MQATETPHEVAHEAPTVSISEKAATQLKKIAENEKLAEAGVRVAVQGGGCSGMTYKLAMESKEREGDKIYGQHGVKVYIDKKSVIYLIGTVLDFSDGLNGKGFTFTNPNAKKTCGCGTSFAA